MWFLIVIRNYGNSRRMWCAPVWWCNWRPVEMSKIQLTKLLNTSKANGFCWKLVLCLEYNSYQCSLRADTLNRITLTDKHTRLATIYKTKQKEAKVQEITVQCEKEEFIELLDQLDQNDTNFDYNTGKRVFFFLFLLDKEKPT